MKEHRRYTEKFVKVIERISHVTGEATSYLLLITVLATLIEVVARYVFSAPTVWSYEVEMFTCGVLYVLVGAYNQSKRVHVNVDLAYRLMGPKLQRFLRLAVHFPLSIIFAGALTYMGAGYAWTSVGMMERSYTSWAPYVWPVKLALPIGALLLSLQLVADFLCDIYNLEVKEK